MKKFLNIVLVILIVPFIVYGLDIKNSSITGDESVYTMSTIPLKVKIELDNFDNLGIAALSYELKFNEYAFNIYDISTLDVWNSKVYKYDNSYYIVSSINPGASNRCSDGLLYCGNYEADVILYAKDTDTIYSDDISIGKIEIGLVNIDYADKEITDKDITVIEGNGNNKKTVAIKRKGVAGGIIVPKLEIKNTKPKINSETKTIKDKKTNYIKSSNNYIEDLSIEGYNLKFREFTYDYDLVVDEGVNSLKVNVKLLSDKAKYVITGNDDLKASDNTIKIIVTAENKEQNTYTIKVNHEKEVVQEKKVVEEKKWYEKPYVKYIGLALGGIIFLIIIINIILRIKDYKMEKALKKL